MDKYQRQNDWNEVRFGDIAEQILDRVTPSQGDEKNFIGLQHLKTKSLSIHNWGDEVKLSAQAFKVCKGDIIFARRNTYLKRVCISPITGICSADAMVIREKKGIEKGFLPFFMLSNQFMDKAISISAGSLSSRVKWKDLAIQKFYIPPLDVQKKYVELGKLIQSIQDKILQLDNSIVNLTNSLIEEILSKKSIKIQKLSDVVDLQVGFAFKSKDFSQDGIALMRGANVGVNTPDWGNGKKYLPEELAKDFENYHLKNKDILIAMDRPFTGAGFKVSRLSDSDLPCLLVQRVGRFQNYNGITPDYLWILLNSIYVKGFLKAQQKGMDIPHLSRKEILSCEVPILSEPDQINISNTVNNLLNQREILENKIISIRDLQVNFIR